MKKKAETVTVAVAVAVADQIAVPVPDPFICAEDECERMVYSHGWCHTHFLTRFSVSTKKAKSEYSF